MRIKLLVTLKNKSKSKRKISMKPLKKLIREKIKKTLMRIIRDKMNRMLKRMKSKTVVKPIRLELQQKLKNQDKV
jgi:hypothetical protein